VNFGIVTGAAPNQKDLLDISAPNIKSYCEAYNYKFDFFDTNLSPWTKSNWSRFPFLKSKFNELSPKLDWILWLDADCLIMDYKFDAKSFIDEKYFCVLGKSLLDPEPKCNTGVMWLKNCNQTFDFINKVIEASHTNDYIDDNDAVNKFFQKGEFIDNVKLIDRSPINVVDKCRFDKPHGHFIKGRDFIYHRAGPGDKIGDMKRHAKKVSTVKDIFNYFIESPYIHEFAKDTAKRRKMRWHSLFKLINNYQLKSFLEIGTAEGQNAYSILKNVKDPEFKFTSVDPYEKYDGYLAHKDVRADQAVMSNELLKSKQILDQFDNLTRYFEKSDDAVDFFEDESFDCIFIDGNHEYEYVKNDIKNYYPKVKKGKWLTGHDYNDPGFPGVDKAVKEFAKENNYIIHEMPGNVWGIIK